MDELLPTTRLKFIVVNNEMMALLNKDAAAFSKQYGLEIPQDWPKFPEAFQPRNIDPANNAPWTGYLFADFKNTKIIGNGGFVKAPDEMGMVEIGYEIAPIFQNQGYATEAVGEMVSFALSNNVTKIIAHTLANKNASNAVLLKSGFEYDCELNDDEVGKIWRFELNI